MTTPYIGAKIVLISKNNVRYEGTLYTIDAKDNSLSLRNVRSFGTEDRKTTTYIPPADEIFEYIVFKSSDINDLNVCDVPSASSVAKPPTVKSTPPNMSTIGSTAGTTPTGSNSNSSISNSSNSSSNNSNGNVATPNPVQQQQPTPQQQGHYGQPNPYLQQVANQPQPNQPGSNPSQQQQQYPVYGNYPQYMNMPNYMPMYNPYGPTAFNYYGFNPYGMPNQPPMMPPNPNHQFKIPPTPQPVPVTPLSQQQQAAQQQQGSKQTNATNSHQITPSGPSVSHQQQQQPSTASSSTSTPVHDNKQQTTVSQPTPVTVTPQNPPVQTAASLIAATLPKTHEPVVTPDGIDEASSSSSDSHNTQKNYKKHYNNQNTTTTNNPRQQQRTYNNGNQHTYNNNTHQNNNTQNQTLENTNKPNYKKRIYNNTNNSVNNNTNNNTNTNTNNNSSNSSSNYKQNNYKKQYYNNSNGKPQQNPHQHQPKSLEEFDFEISNSRFDKDKLAEEVNPSSDVDTISNGVASVHIAYTPSNFFDSISCESLEKQSLAEQGPVPTGKPKTLYEQRKLDQETFGVSSVHRHDNRRGGRGGRGGKNPSHRYYNNNNNNNINSNTNISKPNYQKVNRDQSNSTSTTAGGEN